MTNHANFLKGNDRLPKRNYSSPIAKSILKLDQYNVYTYKQRQKGFIVTDLETINHIMNVYSATSGINVRKAREFNRFII